MQAIADVLLDWGQRVTGSNDTDFEGRARIEAAGAQVLIGPHRAEQVPDDIDELIYTSAITRDGSPAEANPEVARAIAMKVPVAKRSVFVGSLMAGKIGITISGTHGKTTTATLITEILQAAGLNPTALIGAEVKVLRGCGITGTGPYLVVEACEYDRSFLDMLPKIAVLTNIDADHLDYYQDLAHLKEAFGQFIGLVPADGLVVACGDDQNLREILPLAKSQVVTYGFADTNDVVARDVQYSNAQLEFKVGERKFSLPIPGRHLILNALAALVVARHLGVSDEVIAKVLAEFRGATRRFEVLGTAAGVTFMDDYGHHPTEITVLLESARDYFSGRRIWVVFQPHQYSRTRLLLNDFADSLKSADEVIVAPIVAVGDSEAEKRLVNSDKLAEVINRMAPGRAVALPDFTAISDYLKPKLKSGDVVISLGAGKNSEWVHQFKSEFAK